MSASLALGAALGAAALGVGTTAVTEPSATATATAACSQAVTVVETIERSEPVFTQGLVFAGDRLFESGGLYGESELREVDPATWEVVDRVDLPDEVFAEGLTALGSQLYQLTWQEQIAFVWDVESLQPTGQFALPGEGWGLTTDGTSLIVTDGTSTMRWIDPVEFAEVRSITVHDETGPVIDLNELEYVDGVVFANVWQTTRIAVIDPAGGAVLAWLDLADLVPPVAEPSNDVLNGIALVPDVSGQLLVTGKEWPVAYRVDLGEACWAPPAPIAPTPNGSTTDGPTTTE